MAEKKITKKEMFGMLLEIGEVANDETLVNFIKHEIELLDKKASKSSSKRTDANATLKAELLEELTQIGKAVTISEFMKLSEIVKEKELSNQKVSSLFSQMKDDTIDRTVIKGKAYFSAKVEQEQEEQEE